MEKYNKFIRNITELIEKGLLNSKDLKPNDRLFITLKLEGLTMEEITEDLGESAYKIRQLLRKKFKNTENSGLSESLGGIVGNEIIINKFLISITINCIKTKFQLF